MPAPRAKITLTEGNLVLFDSTLEIIADEWVWDQFEVADSTSDSSIFPGNITTATVLFIESDQTVTYEIDGADTTETLTAGYAHLLFGTSITALTITNSSGSTANVRLGVWGT